MGESNARLSKGENWAQAFSVFSDWKKDALGKWTAEVRRAEHSHQDELTRESLGSPFSLGSDPVYLAFKDALGGEHDGFITGKSYTESVKRQDLSEDLADHAAFFRLLPERYCFEGKNLAPRKMAWVADHLFPHSPIPNCR